MEGFAALVIMANEGITTWSVTKHRVRGNPFEGMRPKDVSI